MTLYRVDRDGNLVEYEKPLPPAGGLTIISDIGEFRTQDGVNITSRRSLREYERANNVRQVGNDFASHTAELRRKVYGGDK